MATLIPSIGTCAHRMTSGERRLAERLERKLDGDCRLWYDVPVGPKPTYPDFVVVHPQRGVLILRPRTGAWRRCARPRGSTGRSPRTAVPRRW